MNQEKYLELLREQDRINQEKKQKALRYENRKSMDEIARSLLNGDLFDVYAGKNL